MKFRQKMTIYKPQASKNHPGFLTLEKGRRQLTLLSQGPTFTSRGIFVVFKLWLQMAKKSSRELTSIEANLSESVEGGKTNGRGRPLAASLPASAA